MLEKIYDTLIAYQAKHGNLFIDGINAYVIDDEGFYGPNWLRMGYLTILDTGFEKALNNISEKERISIKKEDLNNNDFLEDLYGLFCEKSNFKLIDKDYLKSQLQLFLEDCISGIVYFVVNEDEYIDLEEATIQTTSYTEWASLDEEEINQWSSGLENASKFEKIEMLF
jgi:hypothetical protein